MPINTCKISLIPRASGIKSKHIIAIIKPDAQDNIKLKNLLEFLFKNIPIIPPSVVPNVPKNKPTSVVFKISNIKTPYHIFYIFYGREFLIIHIYYYSSSPFSFSALSAAIKLSIISSKSPFKKFSI